MAIDAMMRAAIWVTPVCLLAGLVVWLADPASVLAAELLRAGLFALMAIPLLRVVGSVVRALGARDWLFLTATLVVLVELGLTFITAYARH